MLILDAPKGKNKQELKVELEKQTTKLKAECIASRQFLAENPEPDLDNLQEQQIDLKPP